MCAGTSGCLAAPPRQQALRACELAQIGFASPSGWLCQAGMSRLGYITYFCLPGTHTDTVGTGPSISRVTGRRYHPSTPTPLRPIQKNKKSKDVFCTSTVSVPHGSGTVMYCTRVQYLL